MYSNSNHNSNNSIFYLEHVLLLSAICRNEIPGVTPITKFMLGLITLFMGIGGLINLTKPNVDAVEFSVKTLCGLLAIVFIFFAEKFVDIAKLISESL